jgi:ribosomal protein L11 methyltransferase
VRAVDIDPQALLATRENAGRNGMGSRVEALFPEALDDRPVELMIANILANPLIDLAESLAGRVTLEGHIVLTGILAEQAADVMAAYRPWFEFREPVEREGWVLLEGVKSRET